MAEVEGDEEGRCLFDGLIEDWGLMSVEMLLRNGSSIKGVPKVCLNGVVLCVNHSIRYGSVKLSENIFHDTFTLSM